MKGKSVHIKGTFCIGSLDGNNTFLIHLGHIFFNTPAAFNQHKVLHRKCATETRRG